MNTNDTTQNNLSIYRENNHLPLNDLAFLLDMDTGNLFRYEKGQLTPTLKVAIGYHLLFNMPMQTLINQDYVKQKKKLTDRLFLLIEKLQQRTTTERIQNRINAVHKIITRLSDQPDYDLEDSE